MLLTLTINHSMRCNLRVLDGCLMLGYRSVCVRNYGVGPKIRREPKMAMWPWSDTLPRIWVKRARKIKMGPYKILFKRP